MLLGTAAVHSQGISIDRGLRVAGLWCFPLSNDSLSWLYLPDRGLLAMDEHRKPQFSFVRYVNAPTASADADATVTQAGGGAVLHFLVTYDTDEGKIEDAEQKLKELFHAPIKLKGPIIFSSGRYALVSSTINQENGKEEKKALSVGAAPVLQGSRIALSFELDPERAKLLLESLKMPTPDISIVFDMVFSGLTDAYNAKLTVDWDQVNKSRKMGAGVNLYFVSADLEDMYEEMRRAGTIKLETQGEDDKMQSLVNEVYAKVTDLMFQKVEPEQLPADEKKGVDGILDQLFGYNGVFSSGKIFGFGANAVYKKKEIRSSGTSVLSFNSRHSTERHHYITFNIGDFYKRYGQNEDYIRTISLADAAYQIRQVAVAVDGDLLPEFDKLINNVTVKLRKQHEDGSITMDEVNIVKGSLEKPLPVLKYDHVNDKDQAAWLNYEYNAQFSLRGGRAWETGWKKTDLPMVNVLVPYERRVIRLDADKDLLIAKSVRAVTVKVEYSSMGELRTSEITVKPEDDLGQTKFEIILPPGEYKFKYTMTWQLRDGSRKSVTGETDSALLFLDAMPD
jgi:hypothetical protein